MAQMVDVFAGPSTGAILNAALNVPSAKNPKVPKFKAQHMVRFYEREGIKIFPPDRFRDFRGFVHDFNNRTMKIGQLRNLFRHGYYDPAYLSQCLYDLYGDVELENTLKSLVVPVYNIDGESLEVIQEAGETADAPVHTKNNFIEGGGHAEWFKSIRFGNRKETTHKVRLHDLIMASTAAPTYFPCHHFTAHNKNNGASKQYSGIDGSIFDNPCVSYHGALSQHLSPDTRVVMIMLGTGYTLKSISKDDWNSYGGLGVVDPVNDLPLISILFHASESALVDSFSERLNGDIFLFNKALHHSMEDYSAPNKSIDDASPENLEKMKGFAERIIEDNQAQFDKMCKFLVKNYNDNQRPNKDVSVWDKMRGILKP